MALPSDLIISPRATLINPENPQEAYIFAGKQYVRIKINPGGADELVSPPRLIADYWASSVQAAGFPTVHAALPYPAGNGNNTYIFCQDRYIGVTLKPGTTNDVIISGPHKIVDYWPSLRQAGFNTVDAVLPRPGAGDEVYFFSGKLYVVIKVIPGTTNDYIIRGPLVITEQWPSLKQAGFSTVDAFLPSPKGNGEAYVFNGNQYALIRVDASYNDYLVQAPRQVSDYWPSLRKAGFY